VRNIVRQIEKETKTIAFRSIVMVSSISGRNKPRPIEDYPIILTKDENGVLRATPPRPKPEPIVFPRFSTDPDFHLVPQPKRTLSEDGFIGVSYGLTESLFELGLYAFAICLTIGADLGILGTMTTKSRFIAQEEPYTGRAIASRGFLEMVSKPTNRHQTKSNELLSKRLGELVVIFAHMYYSNNNIGEKITQKAPRRIHRRGLGTGGKRGRPEAMVYIPTEGEIKQALHWICFGKALTPEERRESTASESLIRLTNLLTSSAFDHYEPVKPFEIVTSKPMFRSWFEAQPIFEMGICDLPRNEIAKHGGVCPKTALKDLRDYMGIDIKHNHLILKLIWWKGKDLDAVLRLLPTIDEAEGLMASGLLASGTHLRDGFAQNGKAYPYGKEGLVAAKNSGTTKIYVANYPMNTYDSTGSRLNPYI
jgi:hypothetical protein